MFISWGKENVLGHETIEDENIKQLVNFMWCKICRKYKHAIRKHTNLKRQAVVCSKDGTWYKFCDKISGKNFYFGIIQWLHNTTDLCFGDTSVPMRIKSTQALPCLLGYLIVGGVR